MKKMILAVVAMLFAVSYCKAGESAELVITTKDGSTITKVVPLKVLGRRSDNSRLQLKVAPEMLKDADKVVVTASVARASEGEEGYFVADDGLLYRFKHPNLTAERR